MLYLGLHIILYILSHLIHNSSARQVFLSCICIFSSYHRESTWGILLSKKVATLFQLFFTLFPPFPPVEWTGAQQFHQLQSSRIKLQNHSFLSPYTSHSWLWSLGKRNDSQNCAVLCDIFHQSLCIHTSSPTAYPGELQTCTFTGSYSELPFQKCVLPQRTLVLQ